MNSSTSAQFWHGTSTAVLPAIDSGTLLSPRDQHRKNRVSQRRDGVIPIDKFLYVGDPIAVLFSLFAAERLGGEPALALLTLRLNRLGPDPAYIRLARPPFAARTWRSSFVACGQVTTTETAGPSRLWRCPDPRGLARDARATGFDAHLTRWPDPTSWQPYARRLGMQTLLNSALEYRYRVGRYLIRQHFCELR